MNRPVLATAVLLSAALATAGCADGAAVSGAAGAQSYATMVDFYSAVASGNTHCSDATMQPTTVARARISCDLGGGEQLVLQLWRDSASRDQGIDQLTTTRAQAHVAYCVIKGIGDTALWSVDASDNAGVCADISRRLGGQVYRAGGESAVAARAQASSANSGVAGDR